MSYHNQKIPAITPNQIVIILILIGTAGLYAYAIAPFWAINIIHSATALLGIILFTTLLWLIVVIRKRQDINNLRKVLIAMAVLLILCVLGWLNT